MSECRVLTNLKGLLSPDPRAAWAVDRIPDAALALEGGRVLWMGRRTDLPAAFAGAPTLDGGGAKGHGRVDLDGALRGDCTRAFLAWIALSADEWRKVYGEGVARARLDEAFHPFLGGRLPRGETLPAFTPAWLGEGDLLRTSPEGFLRWLNDPEQSELLSRCRRTLGSRSFHFKDLAEMEDWWFQAGPDPGGAGVWTVGGNGEIVAVLHQPGPGSAAQGVARFKAIMGIKRK